MRASPSSAARTARRRASARSTSRRRTFARVSFDLIYALPGETEAAGRRRSTGRSASAPAHLSLYQLTIEPGTRFAAHGRAAASSSRSTRDRAAGALRTDRGRDRRGRHARLRNQQPCAARPGEPPQSRLLALRRLCRRRPRRARPPPRHAHGAPPQAREFPVGAQRATATASSRKKRFSRDRSGRRSAGHGPAPGRGHRRAARSPTRLGGRSSTGARSTGWLQAAPRTQRQPLRADRAAAGCCSTAFSAKLRARLVRRCVRRSPQRSAAAQRPDALSSP